MVRNSSNNGYNSSDMRERMTEIRNRAEAEKKKREEFTPLPSWKAKMAKEKWFNKNI